MEIWRKIKGYSKYLVSNQGRVMNSKTGRILKPDISTQGYAKVDLCKNGIKKKYRIHRLVGKAFIPNYENKPQIDHIDSNRINNNVENLRWCTNKENSNYSNKIGGTRHAKAIIDQETGMVWKSQTDLARYLGVAHTAVSFHMRRLHKTLKGKVYDYVGK